jgi:hypothetical protein
MQKLRPAGLRVAQFQQITSGDRPPYVTEGGGGGPTGSGGGGLGGGAETGATAVSSAVLGTSDCSRSAVDVGSAVASGCWPVHSRNWPHEPQNSSPGLLLNPQLLQITLSPAPDQWVEM